jgi:hypothetical protein
MPCVECDALLLSAAYVKDGHRYTTACPTCDCVCIYVPAEFGKGTVDLTVPELQVLRRLFDSPL